MTLFKEANQVRLQLKMKLSDYSWYSSSRLIAESDGYSVVIAVLRLDDRVRKVIPQVLDGVSIRAELA